MNKVKVIADDSWVFFFIPKKERIEYLGKYLFFSESSWELAKIAKEELESDSFFNAKHNTEENLKGKEYVLCLYWLDDSRGSELADKYKNNHKVRFAGWKSNEDTKKGIYSKKFKSLDG